MPDMLTASNVILDSLSDGVYVCDRDRRIVFWSKAAERITGWRSSDVVGRRCLDDVLCHIDKDGHRLCGEEFCPLHRSMVTGTSTNVPLIVFAQAKDGHRVPMQVSVAPIRDAAGEVIGGVETFRDISTTLADLQRAKRIQTLSLEQDLPEDPRIRFSAFYTPHDIVGGDYFGIRQLDADRYGFLLADAMGHGVAAALHTMHLSSLWGRFFRMLARPAEFAKTVNNELSKVVKDESFATAICGVVDVASKILRIAAAGSPPVVVFRSAGGVEQVESPGMPFGVMEESDYGEATIELVPGDSLLLFSDGVFEVHNAHGELLGVDGLIQVLKGLGYPATAIQPQALEEELLKFSNAIRLDDDVTLIEVHLGCMPQKQPAGGN
jgi:sigma-B regulation protein RsbU (phosphoserine phosphatase)